jgi:hypothetical protein
MAVWLAIQRNRFVVEHKHMRECHDGVQGQSDRIDLFDKRRFVIERSARNPIRQVGQRVERQKG